RSVQNCIPTRSVRNDRCLTAIQHLTIVPMLRVGMLFVTLCVTQLCSTMHLRIGRGARGVMGA
ncbi:hypothetical protein CCL07_21370, partial [Pseudomonas congelans]